MVRAALQRESTSKAEVAPIWPR